MKSSRQTRSGVSIEICVSGPLPATAFVRVPVAEYFGRLKTVCSGGSISVFLSLECLTAKPNVSFSIARFRRVVELSNQSFSAGLLLPKRRRLEVLNVEEDSQQRLRTLLSRSSVTTYTISVTPALLFTLSFYFRANPRAISCHKQRWSSVLRFKEIAGRDVEGS
jgi:hypothetical protein